MAPLVAGFFADGIPVRLRFWDGSSLEPDLSTQPRLENSSLLVRSSDALTRLMWSPGELGLARAFVSGDLDVDGDLFAVLRALERSSGSRNFTAHRAWQAVEAAWRVGAIRAPIAAPPEEARVRGWRHSKRRDAQAISHHYDVGNDFYRVVLGPSMTYSCARFTRPDSTLEQAQTAKVELVCRKLGLHERQSSRLLDVGCGWGTLAIHAAREHGVQVVGVTISREQAEFAETRVRAAGLTDRVEIRLQDIRDVRGEKFDAISSIGMFEHVGSEQMAGYFAKLAALLRPRGRLLNHAISSAGGSVLSPHSFVGRYVFPDGELIDVGSAVLAMEAAGFEVRDVESLREHYATTLRHWVANLRDEWNHAVSLVGERRARVWLLYMAASALGFEDGGIAVHQTLGVIADAAGVSAMPPTRVSWR